MILYTYLKEVGEELKEKISYYTSNNNPYTICKGCLEKHAKDENYKMNYRRPGSAYCVPCSDLNNLHKKENVL